MSARPISSYPVVASRAEAWVETYLFLSLPQYGDVASRAEAWVETGESPVSSRTGQVASRAEAWVETVYGGSIKHPSKRRLPRGGVG